MKAICALLGVLFVAAGCTYTPSGNNYIERSREIVPIEANLSVSPVLEIDDTLKVAGAVKFTYSFDVDNKLVYSSEYWLDGDSTGDGWGTKHAGMEGSIYLHTTGYEDGEHTIYVKLITSSGRENVADKLRAEKIEFRFALPLWFDNAPPTPVSVINAREHDGKLQIQWEKYRRPDFLNYRVSKKQNVEGLHTSTQYVGITGSREHTSMYDPLYIGGEVNYRVGVINGSSYSYSTGKPFTYSGDYPEFVSVDTIAANQIQIKWSKCVYTHNFGQYEIYNENTGRAWTVDNVNDTTFNFFLLEEGAPLTFILSTSPENNDDIRNVRRDTLLIQ